MTPSATSSPSPLPTGTATLLFTDIEGSTRLWESHEAAMRAALLAPLHDDVRWLPFRKMEFA